MQLRSLSKPLVVLVAVAALAGGLPNQVANGQNRGPFVPLEPARPTTATPGQSPMGAVQALFLSSSQRMFGAQQTPYVDAAGEPVVVPAGYGQPCPSGYPEPMPYGDGHCGPMAPHGCTGPHPMGAGGTYPPIGYDLANDVGIEGFLVDQRGPHYFDVRGEAVYMTPDETFGKNIDMTSFLVLGQPGAMIVLNTGQLDYDYETGFRVIGRFDLGPLSVLEFGYMGIYDWQSSASAIDTTPVGNTGDLFSLFSQFGTNPASVSIPGGDMPETERSIIQSISIDSDLQTVEMSARRYWVGFIPRISGTLLAGFRYTKLKEDFYFSTSGEAAQTYSVRADNDLAGFQTGGDIWIGLMQGVRIGAEGKVGLYNNHYTLDNNIVTIPFGTTPPTLSERFADNEAAFISEASFDVVADILPSWSIRGGYEILFMNSIVLAGENFNTRSPYGLPGQAPRIPFVNEQGQNYYHGAHVGLEYIW